MMFSGTREPPRPRGQRRDEASGDFALARGACGLLLCAVMVTNCGCVTRRVWNWAGEGDYTFLPSPVTSLGLAREEGSSDRLYLRVDAERVTAPADEPAPGIEAKSGGQYYVVDVPPGWKERPKVLVPDGIQPGDLQLEDLLAAKAVPAPPDAMLAGLSPVPLEPKGRFPALQSAPYALVEGPPGILFVYGADTQRGRWVRLASMITGEVIASPAPKFNYAIAVMATPVTAAVDAVGVVIYAILWPLWTESDIGYGDGTGEAAHLPDEPGRPQRELERPTASTEETAPPPPPRPAER